MRFLILIVVAGLCAGCGATHASNSGHAASRAQERATWQGTWTMVSCVAGGEAQRGNVEWVVERDHYTIRMDGKSQDVYPFQLDPAHHRIDVNHHDTPEGTYGGKLKGIYEINGDSLKVCYDLKGQRYPSS